MSEGLRDRKFEPITTPGDFIRSLHAEIAALRAEVERLNNLRALWVGDDGVFAKLARAEAEAARLRAALEEIGARLATSHHITIRQDGGDRDGGWIKAIARAALEEGRARHG